MSDVFLSLTHISKSYAGVQALDDVSLVVKPAEIHCLVGENGSGKSTLIKIIAGVVTPDQGEIVINGKPFRRLTPMDAIREGIQVIYQDFSLFPNLTVAENIALNYELSRNARIVRWGQVRQLAEAALGKIGVRLPLDAEVESISVADKQLVAICRALVQNARLIIMDEATTALTEKEIRALFKVIHNVQQEGVAVLFVSHKLDEVLEIADKAMIIRNGKVVVDVDAANLDRNKLVYYMTGRRIEEADYDYTPQQKRPLLEVIHLSSRGNFQDVSFSLWPGEIVGVTGLLGSGRTELALSLFGVLPVDRGEIRIDGKPVHINSIQSAIEHGIGYVPEDRLTEGLFLDQSINRNIVIRTIDGLTGRGGLLSITRLKERARQWIRDLSIKTSDPELPVKSLSGGNQQRVVLAKWLASKPRILILNGPTVGVDVGSKSELHDIIKNLAREGIGILVISDDIPELLHVCNRILLMRRGRLAGMFDRRELDENKLTSLLTESTPAAPAASTTQSLSPQIG
ncbi:MAG: sugar ABC transporter ATP-binding protein [Anaerolineae bacterium]|nr:sugar ABC transporter ATP-binding protein [Thermoflexales bacterium]MDW8406712.1 sugar ABC transporter ATP-binding protein [Anaerolineae bacterium]